MTTWCALKVRIDCPDCGSPVLVDGPYKTVLCEGCNTRIPVARMWTPVIARARSDGSKGKRFRICTMQQSGLEGLGNIYLGLNHDHPPVCSECDAVIAEADQVAEGVTDFHCPACNALHPTWPDPGYLRQSKVARVFMAPPEDTPAGEAPAAKPVHFECPNCGATLKISTETKRICTCEYCDVDTYLPAALWNRLHPIRRRRAFWLLLSS